MCGETTLEGSDTVSRQYGNPPIIEAVCEFRFTTDTQWDLTIPGLIYEQVRTDFPSKEDRAVQEVTISGGPKGIEQQMRTTKRMVFLSDDTRSLIQVGPHLLAVNRLKPYLTWAEFKLQIQTAFTALTGTLEGVVGLERIGLRYINRIEIASEPVNLDDYFEFRPFLGEALPQNITSFIVGCMLPFCEGRDSCKIQLTSAVPDQPDTGAFLLNLDYSVTKAQAVSLDQALGWVETAHQRIEDLFEGCVKDPLRVIFEEVN